MQIVKLLVDKIPRTE